MTTADRRIVLALLLGLLGGCAPTLVSLIEWEPFAAYEPQADEALVSTEPVWTVAADPAAFDGWLIDDRSLQRIRSESARRLDQVRDLEEGRGRDRWHASRVDAAKTAEIKACRQEVVRACAACAAGAAGAAAAIDRGLDEITP